MKLLLCLLAVLLALGVAFGALNYFASERVEVVTLHTLDGKGQPKDTRLWVIDHEGSAYLRARPDAGWYTRLQAQPSFELTRAGVRARYTGVTHPELTQAINELMQKKYGWGDSFIAFTMGGRTEANTVPVQLVPAPHLP